jgi:hypothetical protein
MSHRETDLRMLRELLETKLTDYEREAFSDMLEGLEQYHQLSEKQRVWVAQAYEKIHPQYENLVSSGKVPRGREVETPAVLRTLPKRPPGR